MSDIASILSEIDKLKDTLDERYSKKITIMFTDIKDSTVYFEKNGDMNGRMLIEKHNSMLFPIVEKHGGVIIKTIGDAIMAKYDFALNATKAAIEMQRTLKSYNEEARDKIRIRIGLHTGKAIVEEGDVFGDSVNLAARIESGTKAEFITISKNTLVEIAAYKNIKVEKLGVVKYKGKEEEIETYSVLWDSSILERKVRGDKTWLRDSLLVKMTLNSNEVKIKYKYYLNDEKKEETFGDIDKDIFTSFFEFLEQLRSSTLQKSSNKFDLAKFKEEGKKIYDIIFGESIKKVFQRSDLSYLVIDTDDNFSFFPFGLLHDGKEFLGLKYPIFRLIDNFKNVETDYTSFTFLDYTKDTMMEQEKELSIITKKFKDSNLAYYAPKKEYIDINDYSELSKKFPKDCSHLHFAFHNLFSISFDEIKANDFIVNYNSIPEASLKEYNNLKYIIANSCKTVPILTKFISRENNFLNLINKADIKLYLGNFFNIYDEVGVYFSDIFYDFMLKGYSYPHSVFKAKLKLKEKYGEDSLIWASYTIFADSIESVLERMIEKSINLDKKPVDKNESIQEVKEVENKEKLRGTAETIETAAPIAQQVITQVKTEKESATNKILMGIILILVGVVGFYFFNKNSNNSGNTNKGVVTNNKKDSSTTLSNPNNKNKEVKTDKKEDLLVYKGIKQSDLKDDKVAIKNTDVKDDANTNHRIAVLYFDNTSKNKELDPLRKALTDMLISDMTDVENVNVVEREKLEDIIKELNLSKTKYIDRKSALKIGRMLSAKYIMIGSFMDPPIKGLPIRVDAKIIDVETSEIKWAKGVTGEKKDLYKIEKKLFNKFKKSKFVKNMTLEKK